LADPAHLGQRHDLPKTQFAVVANGQYYGGEFEMAEDASQGSGKLEVVLYR
jgi:hypothetical protein